MTEPQTHETQLAFFRAEDLADKTRREEIRRELEGVRWPMMVSPEYKTGSGFGFLNHPAFPDNVYFLVHRLGQWAESIVEFSSHVGQFLDTLHPGQSIIKGQPGI